MYTYITVIFFFVVGKIGKVKVVVDIRRSRQSWQSRYWRRRRGGEDGEARWGVDEGDGEVLVEVRRGKVRRGEVRWGEVVYSNDKDVDEMVRQRVGKPGGIGG